MSTRSGNAYLKNTHVLTNSLNMLRDRDEYLANISIYNIVEDYLLFLADVCFRAVLTYDDTNSIILDSTGESYDEFLTKFTGMTVNFLYRLLSDPESLYYICLYEKLFRVL